MARCPFEDPKFDIDMDEPCPVCGQLGYHTEEDKCVGNIVDVGDELHSILADALRALPANQSETPSDGAIYAAVSQKGMAEAERQQFRDAIDTSLSTKQSAPTENTGE